MYDKEDPQEPPFYPPVIHDHDDDDDRMVYLYVTDYLINSAFLSVFNRGVIAYNVTPDMVGNNQAFHRHSTDCFIVVTSPPNGVAMYCFDPVCLSACLSVCMSVGPANILVFYFSAIRRDIDLKYIQDTYRVVLNSLTKN